MGAPCWWGCGERNWRRCSPGNGKPCRISEWIILRIRSSASGSANWYTAACRPSRKALWHGLIAGALAGAAFIVYQRWVMDVDRPGGLINSITFGDIVLCMGLMCLAGALDFKGRQALWPGLGAVAELVVVA